MKQKEHASVKAVKLLMSTGAVSVIDHDGMLPLHYACGYGTPIKVLNELLIADPGSIHLNDINGNTPLHLAMANFSEFNYNIVTCLLKHMPESINVKNGNGHTPLQTLINCFKQTSDIEPNKKWAKLSLLAYMYSEVRAVDESQIRKKLPKWLRWDMEHAIHDINQKGKIILQAIADFKKSKTLEDLVLNTEHDSYLVLKILCNQSQNINKEADNIRKRNLKEEIISGTKRRGYCAWRHGRVTLMGQGRVERHIF